MASEDEDRVAELLAQVSKPRERWEPNAGESVGGIVADFRMLDGEYNQYPLLVLDVGEHLLEIRCGRSVLHREVMSRDIRAGDTFAVQYEGEKTAKNGKAYHAYTVAHRSAVESPRVTDTPPGTQMQRPLFDPTEEPF